MQFFLSLIVIDKITFSKVFFPKKFIESYLVLKCIHETKETKPEGDAKPVYNCPMCEMDRRIFGYLRIYISVNSGIVISFLMISQWS